MSTHHSLEHVDDKGESFSLSFLELLESETLGNRVDSVKSLGSNWATFFLRVGAAMNPIRWP